MRLGKINIRRTAIFGSALGVAAVLAVWSQRQPIATTAIDKALAARGIRASYTLVELGFRNQRIENVRIGDPAHPDLTADRIDVSLVPSWGGVAVTAINARGVHLRGTLLQGRLNLGDIDKLRPSPTGGPSTLPAIDMHLSDAHLDLATAFGPVSVVIAGSGRLNDGFVAQVRASSPSMGREGCRLEQPLVTARLTISRRRPALAGLLTAGSSYCAAATTAPVRLHFEAAFGESFDRWTGRARIATPGYRQGPLQVAMAGGQVGFAGNAITTRGTFAFASPAARLGSARMAGLSTTGRFGFGPAVTIDGAAQVARVLADPAQIAALRRALAGAAPTPVGPLAVKLSKAIGDAGDGVTANASFSYDRTGTRISALTFATRRGARLTAPAISVTARGLSSNGDLLLSGGDFPSVRGRIEQASDGSSRGLFVMAPYAAGGAKLALQPLRLAARADGTMRFETVAMLDGPLGGGRVEGVDLPVMIQRTSSGSILIGPGCVPIGYRRLAISGTALARGSLTLCPAQGDAIIRIADGMIRGGARTGPLTLVGQVGAQPLRLSVAGAAYALDGPVSVTNFVGFLGSAARQSRLRVAQITGVTDSRGLSGRFDGLSGNIAQLPFLAGAGKGRWTLVGSELALGGSMMLSDAAAVARFNPLLAKDMTLRLSAGRIAARAALTEPVSGRAVTTVTIDHELSQGVGEARLSVDALTFGKSLQPEAITPLTIGVVADVYGQLDGKGLIQWRGDKITSSGRFRSDGLDFAAAFGPVTGASGEIMFDDLVALSTPPGQQVKLALVNPGVEVRGGTVTYRLRPERRVEIEGGQWPFAGGTLSLDAGTLDLGQATPRRLSFRVTALDAAKFIEQLKLENIAATGTFDGTLPIVFDASGGRIVGGQIAARAGGGTLAYVGDVSNAQTNRFAKLAFDALKSIRYRDLAIDLDGSLDGEIVSLVRFNGVNQAPVAAAGLARSFTNLPFRFNIRISAPFRGLVNTARSYQDPGLLLNRTVQPGASDHRP